MGQQNGQLSLTERCTIARLYEAGQSLGHIASAMDRSASTISRELKRNGGSKVGYQPGYATEQAWARRCRTNDYTWRRYLPRKTSLSNLAPAQIDAIAAACNNTPRKFLDFKTPAEAFPNQPLHCKCESTFPPAPG